MNEIETIIWSNEDNIEVLNDLREAITLELRQSKFRRCEPPAASIEGAVTAYIDACRLWPSSPKLVSLVTELETLARSFRPEGRVRAVRQLSSEAVSALLDEAPGGRAMAIPVALAGGRAQGIAATRDSIALLTDRDADNSRLLGRLQAAGAAADTVRGVAVFGIPAPDRDRMRALFARPDAPGRGDLSALKRRLDAADLARVSASATRAAANLRASFRIWDKRTDHRRGSTVANFVAPAPLARLALNVADLVVPRDEPVLFLAAQRSGATSLHARHVRYIFAEALDAASDIVDATEGLAGLDLLCGIAAGRRISDLRADPDLDRLTKVAERLIATVMEARDTVLLLRAYEAAFVAYTDKILLRDTTPDLLAACDCVLRNVCGALQRRYRLAKADLYDGVFYWTDVQHRATGSAQPRRWLPPSVTAVPVVLSQTPFVPILARPKQLAVLDDIVEDIAAEIDGSTAQLDGPAPVTDPTALRGSSLRGAWTTLKAAYSPEDFFREQ